MNSKYFWTYFIILGLIFYYYFWTASGGSNNFDPNTNIYNYYNQLADAFVQGKLHLLTEPSKEILESPDPYNPATRISHYFYPWDTSLYKGKYYLYYGVTPVITFYLPYKLLIHRSPSDYFAVMIYMFGGLLWTVALLREICNRCFRTIPNWMILTVICVLGLADAAPYMLRRLAHYQVAISCGFFFVSGGIYLLYRGFNNPTQNLKLLYLGSLFLGLAVGARPHLIAVGIVIILSILKVIKHYPVQDKARTNKICAFLLPYLLCLFLLG